jgi:copper chaperone
VPETRTMHPPEQPVSMRVTIVGMHCGSCALLIDDVLADLPGVHSSATSHETRTSIITHDRRATPTDILATIEALGYRAEPSDRSPG